MCGSQIAVDAQSSVASGPTLIAQVAKNPISSTCFPKMFSASALFVIQGEYINVGFAAAFADSPISVEHFIAKLLTASQGIGLTMRSLFVVGDFIRVSRFPFTEIFGALGLMIASIFEGGFAISHIVFVFAFLAVVATAGPWIVTVGA